VSVDTVEDNSRLAEGLGIEFPLLSDSGREAIRAWGLVHAGADPRGDAIARPGVFLIEPDGTVSWRSIPDDWRVRLRPEQVLTVLRSPR